MKKTSIPLLLAVFLLLSACSDGGDDSKISETVSGTTAETQGEPTLIDTLPTDLDFGGYIFTVAISDTGNLNSAYTLVESENGELLNDTAYRRDLTVEDRYNIDLNVVQLPTDGNASIVPLVSKSVMAGEDSYQYVQFTSAWDNTTSLITEGALYNLRELPELNLDSEGFYSDLNETFTINDRLYFGFSNYNNSGVLPLYMVFNKTMISNMGLDMPYDIILDGGWTMDVFCEYIKGVTQDINGDGTIDGYDQHGFGSGHAISNYMVWGFDVDILRRDETYGYIPDIMNDHFVAASQLLLDFKNNNPDVFITERVNGDTDAAHMFLLGNTMFAHTGSGLNNDNMRAIADFDFGVAPFPKFDEAQEHYGNFFPYNQFGIPTTVTEPEIVSAIAEGLAVTSKVLMEPAFLDVYLENKLLRDEGSVQVIRLMQKKPMTSVMRYFNFDNDTIAPESLLTKVKDAGTIVSTFEKQESKSAQKAEKFFQFFFD